MTTSHTVPAIAIATSSTTVKRSARIYSLRIAGGPYQYDTYYEPELVAVGSLREMVTIARNRLGKKWRIMGAIIQRAYPVTDTVTPTESLATQLRSFYATQASGGGR